MLPPSATLCESFQIWRSCLKSAAISSEATKAGRWKVRGWKHSIMGDLVGQGSFSCTAVNVTVAAITDCTSKGKSMYV